MGDQLLDATNRILNSGRAFIYGRYSTSGDWRPVDVDASGRLAVIVSGQPVTVSGDHVFVESGVYVIADIAESGIGVQTQSGIHVWVSGQHVFVESGVHVIADIQHDVSSGLHVWISGQHMYQESGAFVTTQPGIQVSGTVEVSGTFTVASGLHVYMSGQHFYQESGAFVTTQPGIQVSGIITVDPVSSSGLHVNMSGQHAFIEISPGSGQGGYPYNPFVEATSLNVSETSGQSFETQINLWYAWNTDTGDWKRFPFDGAYDSINVMVISGIISMLSGNTITIDPASSSGLHVYMSGQHFFQESGAFVKATIDEASSSGLHVEFSGRPIHVGCSSTIRTGNLVQISDASGGDSICVVTSGLWCSGEVHTIILKNLDGNGDMFIGETSCRPFSGYGFLLADTEAINLDICSVCDMYICANVSGEYITWIGTDY